MNGEKLIAFVDEIGEYFYDASTAMAHMKAGKWHNKFADGDTLPDLKLQNIEIEVTPDMLIKDTIAIGGLLFISVSVAGIMIMRKKPKEILSEMS